MTFKEFAINYLSPIYLLLRIAFLGAGGLLLLASSQNEGFESFGFLAIGLLLVYNSIRPWKTGAKLKDLANIGKVD